MHPLKKIRLGALFFFASTGLSAAEQTSTIWRLEQPAEIGGHPATVMGHPQAVAEKDGSAIHFDGVADGLLLPVNPLVDLTEFTIELLFKPEAGGPAEQRFLHVQDEHSNRALMEIRLTGDQWALDTFLHAEQPRADRTLLDRTKRHPAGRWTWIALVFQNGHMAHYVNGVKELEGDVAFTPMVAGQISLGVRQNRIFWFKGAIREVRFHPVALAEGALQHAASK